MTWLHREARRITQSGWTFAALWAISRAFLAYEWSHKVSYIVGDVNYYLGQVTNTTSWSSSLVEYPTPVAWAMHLLRVLSGGNQGAFVWSFVYSMLALDAVMAMMTWKLSSTKMRIPAVLTWIAFVVLMGPIVYFRFDMAPAVLAGAGAFLFKRRPALAGALIACGAALKLWPALLILPLLGFGRRGKLTAIGFGMTGGFLALASLIFGGWQRLISPLTWQSARGLQIESLPATPLMWLRSATSSRDWLVALSRYNAYEISGPGVQVALQAANVATMLGFLLAIIIGVRAAWAQHRTTSTVAAVMLAIILIMIDVNKTLSPQYLLWLGGPLAALIGGREVRSRSKLRWPVLCVLTCLLLAFMTQIVYPLRYGDIVSGTGATDAVAVLVLRNALLVVITVIVSWRVWGITTRPEPTHPRHDLPEAEVLAEVA